MLTPKDIVTCWEAEDDLPRVDWYPATPEHVLIQHLEGPKAIGGVVLTDQSTYKAQEGVIIAAHQHDTKFTRGMVVAFSAYSGVDIKLLQRGGTSWTEAKDFVIIRVNEILAIKASGVVRSNIEAPIGSSKERKNGTGETTDPATDNLESLNW